MKNFSLNTEDFIFIILIIAIVINIIGNSYIKKGLYRESNKYFLTSLVVTIIIYFYFLYRNYNAYKNCSLKDKKVFKVKLLSTCFLIAGVICLIYFQINDPNSSLAPVV